MFISMIKGPLVFFKTSLRVSMMILYLLHPGLSPTHPPFVERLMIHPGLFPTHPPVGTMTHLYVRFHLTYESIIRTSL